MKHPLRIIGFAIAIILTGAAGYLAGRSQGYAHGIEHLKRQTAGNLGAHVEVLARLRTGDAEGAAALLDRSVDTAVATLPQGKTFSQKTDSIQRVLMAARTYRDAYPTDDPAAAAVLKDVTQLPPDHEYCSPALGAVVKKARRGGS